VAGGIAREQTTEALRENNDLLVQQAFADTNNSRGPILLQALERTIDEEPANYVLWYAKARALERGPRLERAVTALSTAIQLASAGNNVPKRIAIDLRLRRSGLFRQLGRAQDADLDYAEAGDINCERKHIRFRDPRTSAKMLDLSPYLQSSLPEFFNMLSVKGREAAITISDEVKRNTGIGFDLRGWPGRMVSKRFGGAARFL